jgi:hypothetical protein
MPEICKHSDIHLTGKIRDPVYYQYATSLREILDLGKEMMYLEAVYLDVLLSI